MWLMAEVKKNPLGMESILRQWELSVTGGGILNEAEAR
jgi:hypothetical protein